MDWREMAEDKLMSPPEAVKAVGSGDQLESPRSMLPRSPCARRYMTAGVSWRECTYTIRRSYSPGFSPAKRTPSNSMTSITW